ncbi:DNA ligase [Gossypium australe]|uniref:DNA ligase n=1 Tax=Gossypium australe TaxID=47621 RepID=A0A5B6WPI2_9ROSI|nr:DNA ligase [Gossypium australe]
MAADTLFTVLIFQSFCAPDGGAASTSTFKVSSKGKAVVVDLSSTLKRKHVCLAGSSDRFEALSVELEDSNDVVADDIDTEQDVVDDDNRTNQLKFSPRKPRLASLVVAHLVRFLMATKQENLDKGKKKMNNSPAKGYDHAVNGRIWLIWKSACIVDVLYVFGQYITCSVQVQHQKVFFSTVYACNDGVSRRELWSHMCSISVGVACAILAKAFLAKVEELESLQLALLRGDLVRNGHIDQGNEKSAGPNGFTAFFFKSVWGIVGRNFLKAGRSSLSPYLFVLAMDVLSKLLDVAAINALFKYHPKCIRVRLAHLMFADDLVIFSKGTTDLMELALMTTCTRFKVGRLLVRKSLLGAILKLAWSAYLYVIWKQRNKRHFGASFLIEDAILVQIKEIVRARLGGRPINRTDLVNASLCASWVSLVNLFA